jgi:DNA polymerase III subunit delta
MSAVKPDGFVRQLKAEPRRYHGILVFGPNWDLVQRIKSETLSSLTAVDPLVEVVRLATADIDDNPGKILEELQALSLFGSSKIVTVEAASASVYKECVSATTVGWSGAMLLVTAGDLKKTVAMRKEFEASPELAAVCCYEQTSDELAAVVVAKLAAEGLQCSRDVAGLIVEAVAGNAALLDSELDKIVAYCRGQDSVTLGDTEAVCAINRSSPLDAVIDGSFAGQTDLALASLRNLRNDGVAASSILVTLTNHFVMLMQMHAACGDRRADTIIKEWRPPVFWKRQPAIADQVQRLARNNVTVLAEAIQTANAASRMSHEVSWPLLERLVLALSTRSKA